MTNQTTTTEASADEILDALIGTYGFAVRDGKFVLEGMHNDVGFILKNDALYKYKTDFKGRLYLNHTRQDVVLYDGNELTEEGCLLRELFTLPEAKVLLIQLRGQDAMLSKFRAVITDKSVQDKCLLAEYALWKLTQRGLFLLGLS
jgi:hypothetical protein